MEHRMWNSATPASAAVCFTVVSYSHLKRAEKIHCTRSVVCATPVAGS